MGAAFPTAHGGDAMTFNGVIIQCITAYPTYSNTSNINRFSPIFSTTMPEIFPSKLCFQLTKIEMMPLNFSSTKSQIILLLKYWTGSHCKDKKSHLGENNSRLEKKCKFQNISESTWFKQSLCQSFFTHRICFPDIAFIKIRVKSWDGITHFQLSHTVTRVSKRREKGKFFNSLIWRSWQGLWKEREGGFGLLPRCPRTRTPPALTSGSALWRAAATFHCNN